MEKEKQGEQEVKLPKPTLIEDLGLLYPTVDSKQKRRFGLYKCGFCGTEFKANTSAVNRGNTKSCGCYNRQLIKEVNTIHGMGHTKIYKTWASIKYRVSNYNNKRYKDYVGRGITICDEWKNDFMSFYNWAMLNGYSDELTIDRIDNDGNYEPSNCRWVTTTIQARNRRILKSNKSGYRGVYCGKGIKKFKSTIRVNSKQLHLGSFLTAVEGAIAYNNYIIENNLEGFILNEIPQEYLEKEITDE